MTIKKQPQIRFGGFGGDWEEKTIGEIFQITSGTTPLRSNPTYFENGIIDWVKTTDLNNALLTQTEEKVSQTALNETSLKVLPENTVFVAMYGGFNQIGRTGLLTMNAVCNQALAAILPQEDFSSFFLLAYLNGHVADWKNVAASSRKDPNITKDNIASFEFFYPPLSEQIAIGQFFRQLDEMLTLAEQKHAQTVQLKKALLGKLFPISGSLQPQIRLKGFSGDWVERKLGDCFAERVERSAVGELISVTMNSGVVKASSVNRVDNSSDDKSNYKKVEIDDIAYNSMRMWQGASGVSEFSGILSPAYTVLVPSENVNSLFFAYMFKLPEMLQVFQKNSQGLTSDTWNLKYPALKEITVRLPETLAEQTAIGKLFQTLDHTIALQAKEITQIKQLKSALLGKMFV